MPESPRGRSASVPVRSDNPSATDAAVSIQSHEFVWSSGDTPESHDYIAGPVMRTLHAARARTVLDMGCGNGALTALLAGEGFATLGVDGSESGVHIARARHPGLRFDVVDLAAGFHGRFDAVVAAEVIEHLMLPRMLFAGALQALRPGGTLVVTTPYHGYLKNLALALTNGFDAHWHPLRDYGHIKFFSPRTLGALFAEFGLRDVRWRAAGRIPPLAKSMVFSGTKPT
jgi:SAM-dependent methyltransferase